MMNKSVFVIFALILTLMPLYTQAVCCYRKFFFGQCENAIVDCKGMYCGMGDCNIFGCNCDLGCVNPIQGCSLFG